MSCHYSGAIGAVLWLATFGRFKSRERNQRSREGFEHET